MLTFIQHETLFDQLTFFSPYFEIEIQRRVGGGEIERASEWVVAFRNKKEKHRWKDRIVFKDENGDNNIKNSFYLSTKRWCNFTMSERVMKSFVVRYFVPGRHLNMRSLRRTVR